MDNLIISEKTLKKLIEKHNITKYDIEQAFANIEGEFLIDKREKNKTDPPTAWFVSENDYGVKVKVCFMIFEKSIIIKTAYRANEDEIFIYNKYS